MSKVEELKLKYRRVTPPVFSFFEEADKTPTKKYLEYYLKIWDTRSSSLVTVTKNKIVDNVKEFDELLPYIVQKDIYNYNSTQQQVSRNTNGLTNQLTN